MNKITWHIETRKVTDLKDARYNPRTRTQKEIDDLRKSIDTFGAVEPGVINIGTRENILIGGHGRRDVYSGIKESMEVMVPDRELTLKEEKELNLRLNKNTGSWDHDKLADMGLDLLLEVGFGEEDLAGMYDDVDVIDDEYNLERALQEIKTPTVHKGELWELGMHRLMVGDISNPEDIVKLVGGTDLPDMIYNDSRKTTKKIIEGVLTNSLAIAKPNVHIFWWCEEKEIGMVQELYKEHDVVNKSVPIWIKNQTKLEPDNAFNKIYQPCVYGARGEPFLNTSIKNLNEVLNKEVETGSATNADIMDIINLWLVDRKEDDYNHPLYKPITLAEKPLKRCTGAGSVVLDTFGGVGSMLIACTQLARKCRTMESDEILATIIIDRWEKFTNKKAKRI